MKNKEKKLNLLILALSFLFFFVYSYTSYFVWMSEAMSLKQVIFNWPDANANYFFTQLFAEQGKLFWYEPLNLLTDNLFHTRSINVIDGSLVPIIFLPAIVIFGVFAKLLGSVGVLFLTPFLAALSGYIIYRLTYYIFKDLDIAFWTAVLFLSLAPWIFFANVVMLPTVLFIFLVLVGWLAIAKSLQSPNNLWWILGSLFLSLALVVRPTEVIWMALLWIFVIYLNKKKLNYKRCLEGLLIFLAVLFAFLSFNKLTYGGFLSLGYFNLQSGQLDSELNSSSGSTFNSIKLLIAPFGFDLILIIKNFYKYFIEITLVQFLLAIAGSVYLLTKENISFVWKKYLLLTPFIFILVLLYYGSWDLADPLVKELNKISISYVRYFMPLYIWILPLIALALKEIFWKNKKLKYVFPVLIILIFIISFKISFY
ncbi:hypothetical protein K8R42_00455, partial [bacterium]|nr:hypothetical protein [bacterium]